MTEPHEHDEPVTAAGWSPELREIKENQAHWRHDRIVAPERCSVCQRREAEAHHDDCLHCAWQAAEAVSEPLLAEHTGMVGASYLDTLETRIRDLEALLRDGTALIERGDLYIVGEPGDDGFIKAYRWPKVGSWHRILAWKQRAQFALNSSKTFVQGEVDGRVHRRRNPMTEEAMQEVVNYANRVLSRNATENTE